MPGSWPVDAAAFGVAIANVSDVSPSYRQTALNNFVSAGYTLSTADIQAMEDVAWAEEDEFGGGVGIAVLNSMPATQPPRKRPIVGL